MCNIQIKVLRLIFIAIILKADMAMSELAIIVEMVEYLVTGLASTINAQSNMTGQNMTGGNMTGGNMTGATSTDGGDGGDGDAGDGNGGDGGSDGQDDGEDGSN
jgi:hypothetical protein